jgi:transposase
MAKVLVSDAFWEEIRPLLPPHRPRPKGGRPPIDDRAALTGIIFVLRTGIPWEYLPAEMGCGCGMTCWRRLRDWQLAGVWSAVHLKLLQQAARAGRLDASGVVDSSSVRAEAAGELTGPSPTDRAKNGSKHHLLTDGQGVPLVVQLTGANVPDMVHFIPLIDAYPVLQGPKGRPRRHPRTVYADKGYDSAMNRRVCKNRGIRARIARRGIESKRRLGRHRWVVERTNSWLHRFRRLMVRYERRGDIHLAFLSLACALIVFQFMLRV